MGPSATRSRTTCNKCHLRSHSLASSLPFIVLHSTPTSKKQTDNKSITLLLCPFSMDTEIADLNSLSLLTVKALQ